MATAAEQIKAKITALGPSLSAADRKIIFDLIDSFVPPPAIEARLASIEAAIARVEHAAPPVVSPPLIVPSQVGARLASLDESIDELTARIVADTRLRVKVDRIVATVMMLVEKMKALMVAHIEIQGTLH